MPLAKARTYRASQTRPVQNVYGFDNDLYREAFVEIDEMAERALFDA